MSSEFYFEDRKKFAAWITRRLIYETGASGPTFAVAAAEFFAWRAVDHLSAEIERSSSNALDANPSLEQFEKLIIDKAPMLLRELSKYRDEVYKPYRRTNRNYTLNLVRNFIIDRRGECIYPFCRNTP